MRVKTDAKQFSMCDSGAPTTIQGDLNNTDYNAGDIMNDTAINEVTQICHEGLQRDSQVLFSILYIVTTL